MTEIKNELKRLTPLRKVVAAAIIDTWEDISKVEPVYSHWAARGLKKLNREILKTGIRKSVLRVNRTTGVVVLPVDCDELLFVGAINDCGRKIPMKRDSSIVDINNIDISECKDSCERCGQDKSICNDLEITEESSLANVNGNLYEQVVTKKVYPSGEMYIETRMPVWNLQTNEVEYTTTKEFAGKIDKKPCGCVEETESNIDKIKSFRFDVFCSCFCPCDTSKSSELGSYRYFPESNLIQFPPSFGYEFVYIEYRAFLTKINGAYYVPEVAFETLVEWTKFMSLDGKRNIPAIDKKWRWDRYITEKKNMSKILGRVSLDSIVEAWLLAPRFAISSNDDCGSFHSGSTPRQVQTSSIQQAVECVCTPSSSSSPSPVLTPFQLVRSVKAPGDTSDSPIEEQTTFQHDSLKGALNLNYFILANTVYTVNVDFTFDSVTGTIDISPNQFFRPSTIVIPFSKYIS